LVKFSLRVSWRKRKSGRREKPLTTEVAEVRRGSGEFGGDSSESRGFGFVEIG
jgi:hypothetical protein